MTVTHAKVSAVADGADATEIRPSDWNASHVIEFAHACFSDSTTQTIANTANAQAVTFNTNEELEGVTHSTSVNPSRIYLDQDGCFLITFSAITVVGTANKTVDLWLRVGGADVPRSNTISTLNTAGNTRVVTVTFMYEFAANEYFEIYWASNIATGQLLATAAGTGPTRPACPSIICTVNKISDIWA